MTSPLKVFFSYAHEDEAHRETLARHLSALEHEGLIEVWHDRKITAGGGWAGAINDALASADIVLLLISADFLDSEYANDVELTEALRLDDTGRARVVPVILRSCDWEHSRFARFNALPPDGEPVVEAAYPDQRFRAVAKGLRALVAEVTTASQDMARDRRSADGRPASAGRRRESTLRRLGALAIGRGRRGRMPVVLGLAVMVLLFAFLVGLYALLIRRPLNRARDAMRMGRYDNALNALDSVPAALGKWPELAAIRSSAELGARTYAPLPDWEDIGQDLRSQHAERPTDADVNVLLAQYWLWKQDYDQARSSAEAARTADAKNAEAWFLLGLNLDLAGDVRGAKEHYRRATEAAQDSPQYRNNLAHALLELGSFDEAIQEYRLVRQFPLAPVERALAHWAKGELGDAADAQASAIRMLEDAVLSDRFYNRREWIFLLRDIGTGIGLGPLKDKRCYAELGEAASQRLKGEAVAFPPADCRRAPVGLRELVAHDLCQFVDKWQPTLRATARELRQALGMPGECPAASTSGPPTPQLWEQPSGAGERRGIGDRLERPSDRVGVALHRAGRVVGDDDVDADIGQAGGEEPEVAVVAAGVEHLHHELVVGVGEKPEGAAVVAQLEVLTETASGTGVVSPASDDREPAIAQAELRDLRTQRRRRAGHFRDDEDGLVDELRMRGVADLEQPHVVGARGKWAEREIEVADRRLERAAALDVPQLDDVPLANDGDVGRGAVAALDPRAHRLAFDRLLRIHRRIEDQVVLRRRGGAEGQRGEQG